jgi:hypothetical protein
MVVVVEGDDDTKESTDFGHDGYVILGLKLMITIGAVARLPS